MGTFLKILTDIFGIPELRRRVLITFALLTWFRIPPPVWVAVFLLNVQLITVGLP